MAEGVRIPTREEANDWLGGVSEKSGKVLEQVKNKVTRRKEQRNLGAFLKENMWLPILLGLVVIAGIVVVARSRQTDIFSTDIDLNNDWDV
jgi:hypothetical protein